MKYGNQLGGSYGSTTPLILPFPKLFVVPLVSMSFPSYFYREHPIIFYCEVWRGHVCYWRCAGMHEVPAATD